MCGGFEAQREGGDSSVGMTHVRSRDRLGSTGVESLNRGRGDRTEFACRPSGSPLQRLRTRRFHGHILSAFSPHMASPGSASPQPQGVNTSHGPSKSTGAWTDAELGHLRSRYGIDSDQDLADAFGRDVASVRAKAAQLFAKSVQRAKWSEDELVQLRAELGDGPLAEVARRLDRTPAEVEEKLSELGGEPRTGAWSREEVQRLRQLYGRRTDRDLANILQRSIDSVRRMARRLALAKDKAFLRQLEGSNSTRMPRWSAEELARLVDLYPATANLEIAHLLGRSVKSIVSKAHHMGLRKGDERLREMGRQNVSLRRDR